MDKLYAIKIRQSDGTYGDEIPINVLAQNVDWDSSHTLVDILGVVDTTSPIQSQINNLVNTKASQADVNLLETRIDNIIANAGDDNTEIVDIRTGADGMVYSNAGNAVRSQITDVKNVINSIYDSEAFELTNIALSDYTVSHIAINSSSKWSTGGRSKFIPVSDYVGRKLVIKGNSTNGAQINFLTSNTYTNGQTVSTYCQGTGRTPIAADEERTFIVPSDCQYINLMTLWTSNSNDYTPQYVKVTQSTIPEIKSTVEAISNAASLTVNIDFTYGNLSNFYISPTSLKWSNTSGSMSKLVPTPQHAHTITITANDNGNADIAFLASNSHTHGDKPDWATGENGLHVQSPGTTVSYNIPADCTYIYVYMKVASSGIILTPVDAVISYYSKALELDDTLTQSGKAADAKATGDTVRGLSNIITPTSLAYEYAEEDAYVTYADPGSISTNKSPFSATDYVDISGLEKIAYTQVSVTAASPLHGMAFYDENKAYISGVRSKAQSALGSTVSTVIVPEGAVYARFTWWNSERRELYGEFAIYDYDQYDSSLDGRVERLESNIQYGASISALLADVPQNEGVQNAILTARQFTDVEWTPLADVPGLYRDPVEKTLSYKTHKKGCRQTGITYDSGIGFAYQVGDSIIFDTFLTALKNPNSLMYTQNRYNDNKMAAYYGISCSKMVQTCWGAPALVDSQQIYKLPGIVKIADPGGYSIDDLELGDGILNPQVHCTLVTGIFRDTSGKARAVEISESTTVLGGYCRRLTWSEAEFNEHFASYGLYRYPLIVNAKYRKARYIDLGDGITGPDDIPIGIRRGSYINMQKSSSFKADVDSTKWIILHDVVDGIDVTSSITEDEITLPKNRYGYHEIYPEDASENRGNASYYFIPDYTVSATVANDEITVNWTSNAPAIALIFDTTHYTLISEDTGTITVPIPSGKTSCYLIFRSDYGSYISSLMHFE